ncbi:HEPN domain-containing protein [Candidatus Woesearchaeota archaeon]|nr:HEPN domain-containing protein [Candidatus Woesearchaeota archaeon]
MRKGTKNWPEKAEAPQEIKEKCDKLTWVYIETRYPDYSEKNSHDKFTKDVVRKHILIAEEILAWVEEKI